MHSSAKSLSAKETFLICGLGSLGQNCVVALKKFGVRAITIEQVQTKTWEIPHLSELLDDLIWGDCRQNRVLEQAAIAQCRAALLVTSNEQVNIETALAVQFQFAKPRPPTPQQNHVVIVGLGRVGQQVAALLQEFKQPLVGITFNSSLDRAILPQMPLIEGKLTEALAAANLSTAKSIVALTDDEILNLEVALMVQTANPHLCVVIRTFGTRLCDRLSRLFPQAQGIGTYAVAAEAFAAAAFGENIINLFRLNDRTILVAEYQIEAADTLNGFLLGEVAYGYDVVPILHQKPAEAFALMPSDDVRLASGDRLIILARLVY